MARLFDDLASDQLSALQSTITGYPFSISAWFYSDDLTNEDVICALAETGGSFHEWSVRVASTSGVLSLTTNSGLGSGASTTNAVTTNTWRHALIQAVSASERYVVLDGVFASKGTDTTANTPLNIDRFTIGSRGHSAGNNRYWSGRIAEVALWSAAVSDADAATLALGYSPLLVRSADLEAYWPVIGKFSPEIDPIGKIDLTVTGTVAAEHPRIIYPGRRRVFMGTTAAAPGYLLVAN